MSASPAEGVAGSGFEHAVAAVGEQVMRVLAKALSAESLTSIAGIAIVLVIEWLVLGFRQSSVHRLLHPTKSTFGDIAFYFIKVFGLQFKVVALFSLGISAVAVGLADRHLDLSLLLKVEQPIAQIALFIVLTDFISYWTHRGRHWFGWWWELHKYHHSAEEMNAITTTRGHPLDIAAIYISNAIPLALLGGSMGDSLLLLIPFGVHAGLTHSMLPWDWGWFGKYVVFSPMGHRVHHSALPEHRDKNFGALLPIWDLMFGTYYAGDVVNETVGIDDNYHNRKGFLFDMFETTRRAARAAFRRTPTAG